MYKLTITQLAVAILSILLLSGCGNSAHNININETNISTSSYDELIHINNCGGKADSDQTVSHSYSTRIEGAIEIGVQQVVEGSISAKYSQYQNVTKSQHLIAPPETNMEFVLRWSEEVRTGNVYTDSSVSTYEVRIPIAVEQVASHDLGCGIVDIPISENQNISPTTQPQSSTPTQAPLQNQLCPSTITKGEVNLYTIGVVSVSTVQTYIVQFDTNRYGGEFLKGELIPAGVVVATNFDEVDPNGWMKYPVTPLVHSGSWGLFLSTGEYTAPNAGACRLIIP